MTATTNLVPSGRQTDSLFGALSAMTAVFSWSLSGTVIKMGLSQIEPVCHVFLRLSVASLILTAYWFFTKKNSFNLLRAGVGPISLFILLIIVNTFTQTYAIKGVPYSWYVVLFSFQPVFALAFMDPQMLIRKSGIGVLIAVVGVLFFVENKTLSVDVNFWDLLLVFFAMSLWTIYTLSVNKLNRYFSGTEINLITIFSGLIGSFIAIIFFYFTRGLNIANLYQNTDLYEQIFLTGVLTTLIYGLYSQGLRLAPSLTVVLQYIDPVVGCLLAVALLQESLSQRQWIGGVLILLGIYLTERWMRAAKRAQAKLQEISELPGEVYG